MTSQERANELRDLATIRADHATATIAKKIATIAGLLADLDPHVGTAVTTIGTTLTGASAVTLRVGYPSGRHFGYAPPLADRITVTSQDERFRRTTLTYTSLGEDKLPAIAARIRGIIVSAAERTRLQAEWAAQRAANRKAEAERAEPVRQAIVAFREAGGRRIEWKPAGDDRYTVTLDLSQDELTQLLQTLAVAR